MKTPGRLLRHRSTFLILTAALGLARAGLSAYLHDVPQTLTQPDGTTISCFATGDERSHWLHDGQGHLIVRNPDSGYWVWATQLDGTVVASSMVVGTSDPAAAGIPPGLHPQPSSLSSRSQLLAASTSSAPSIGIINNLVVFVRFAGEPELGQAISTYDELFNAPGMPSLAQYYAEVSYGQLQISSTFYPSSPGPAVVSYQDEHPRTYYLPFDAATNPDGYASSLEQMSREHALVASATEAIASQVDPTLVVDGDGDGLVDNVCLVISGAPHGWSSVLWPHRWCLSSHTVLINGAQVWDYNVQLQTSITVGVLCHEMFHTLGAPDLYRYGSCSSQPGISPIGPWGLMDWTSEPPRHMSAYMKATYGGWIAEIPEITASGTYTLHPLTSPVNNAYMIASPVSPDEYFVIEYRRAEGVFEQAVPGEGLLVYRVNPWAMGNACGPPDELYLYRPGGTPTTNGNLNEAHLGALTGRDALNDTTSPSSFLSTGLPGGLDIAAVGVPGDTITFAVNVCPAAAVTPYVTSFTAAGGEGSVDVTADPGCAWTAFASETWIEVTTLADMAGSGLASFTVAENAGKQRSGWLYIAGQQVPITQDASTKAACLCSDFEVDDEGWTTQGDSSLWHRASSCAASTGNHSLVHAFYFGQSDSCTYDTGERVSGSLLSPSITLTPGTSVLYLSSFLQTDGLETSDTAVLEVSVDGGKWTLLDSDISHGGSLDDTGGGWQELSYDLSPYSGGSIRLRFSFDSQDKSYNGFTGWLIDDVSVYGPCDRIFTDSFEGGDLSAWS